MEERGERDVEWRMSNVGCLVSISADGNPKPDEVGLNPKPYTGAR